MILVGICGRKRHGKDEIGRVLREAGNFTPIAFADPIKRVLMDLYGFSYDQVFGDRKEEPDPRWDGLTPRTALQRMGTEVARSIHDETWVRYCLSLIEEASRYRLIPAYERRPPRLVHLAESRSFVPFNHPSINPKRWVITDVRFPNEAEAIRKAGGKIVKVFRPSYSNVVDAHASEAHIDEIEADFYVLNDASLLELRAKALAISKALHSES